MTTKNDHPLMAYLKPEAACLGLEASTYEEVIRTLAAKLYDTGYVKDSFADAVVTRERTMPTGLPLGHEVNVAIPHADPVHVLRPALAIATLARPVSFANMEDPDELLSVGIVFLMALNDKDRQIDMLQAIIATAQDSAMIETLRKAGNFAAIAAALEA